MADVKIHKFRIPFYNITMVYCADEEKLHQKYEIDVPRCSDGWVTHTLDNEEIVIWVPHKEGSVLIPVLVHECFHVAMRVAKIIGIQADVDNHEALAYIAGWASERVLDAARRDWKSATKP